MSITNPQTAVEEFQPTLVTLVRLLVDEPDAVRVSAAPDGDGVLFHLSVAAVDLDRVSIQGGRTTRALRTVLRAASQRYGVWFGLDIAPSRP